jgi:3-methylfumaryl-CoA hydratase
LVTPQPQASCFAHSTRAELLFTPPIVTSVATSPPATHHDWQAWLGRTEQRTDFLTPATAAALAAVLDHDAPEPAVGAEPPPLTHWLLFHPLTRQSALDADGHTRRGGFLPPIPLPRRMWAGSRLDFHRPLRVGEQVSRISHIASIQSKQGRGGALVFITVRQEISTCEGLALVEEQDIVYREAPSVTAESAAPLPHAAPTAEFERSIVPDPVLLFRYSALTFNSHRIHYDLPYVTAVEGYPSLVVHGPLTATLLLDLLQRQRLQLRLRRVTLRALRPLFADQPFTVCGRWEAEHGASLWARGPDGQMTMQAQAELG